MDKWMSAFMGIRLFLLWIIYYGLWIYGFTNFVLCSVLGTLTNAYNAGWDVVMVNDCCATTTDKAKEASFTIHSLQVSYMQRINE